MTIQIKKLNDEELETTERITYTRKVTKAQLERDKLDLEKEQADLSKRMQNITEQLAQFK